MVKDAPWPATPPIPSGSDPRQTPLYKAAGLIFVRRHLHADQERWRRASAYFTPHELQCLDAMTAMDWLDIRFAARIFRAAGNAMDDDVAHGMRLAGRIVAIETLRGPYTMVLRVLAVSFAVRSATRLWGLFHRRGRVEVLEHGDRTLTFVVRDYPDLPEDFREALAGWVEGLFEVCGETAPRVSRRGDAEGWITDCVW